MKKLISLILVISMFLSCITVANVAVAAEKTDKNKAELLYALGCIDEEMAAKLASNDEISRGEFAQILYRIAKLETGNENVFSDVSSGSAYVKAINAVNQYKIMMGNGSGNFNPDNKVSETDALVAILRLLGYEDYAYYNGGYPTGYFIAARETKLLHDLSGMTSDKITGNTLSVLLVNMLNERIYEIDSVDGDYASRKLTEKTFLTIYYDIERVSGVVTGNTGTLLNASKETGGLIINDRFIAVEDASYDTFIGMNCDAYYKIVDNSLLYIEATDKNSIETINADVITDVRSRSIIYELSEGHEKTITFPWDAYILYNGRYLNHYTESVIDDMATGEIKLIDNNNDGKIDVVSIFSYETYIIDKVNAEDEIITFKYGAPSLDSAALKEVPIFGPDGKTKLTWLHEWEALDVLKDDKGKVVAIYTSGQVKRKEVEGISLDRNDGYVSFTDGTSAPIHKNAIDRFRTLEVKTVNAFTFDIFGNLVTYTKDEMGRICVLIASGETKDFEPELMVKYYTDGGEILQTKLEGIIKLNDVSRKLSNPADYEIVKEALSDANGHVVELKSAADGKIESISIMEIVYNSNGAAIHTYFNNYANMICPAAGEQYLMKKSGVAFYVPRDLSDVTELDFAVRKVTSVGERNVSLVIYRKLGSTDIEADVVKFVKTSGMDSMGSYDNPMLISRKTKVFVEAEDCVYTKLSYWHGGGEHTALVKDAEIISHIDEGDVAWIDVDEGEIIGAVKYFDYSENKTFLPETSTPKGFTASKRMNRGYVKTAYDDCYQLAIPLSITSNGTTTESETVEFHRYPTYGYVFDSSKTVKVRKATAADFIGKTADPVNYSNVFVHISYTTDYMAVVYK